MEFALPYRLSLARSLTRARELFHTHTHNVAHTRSPQTRGPWDAPMIQQSSMGAHFPGREAATSAQVSSPSASTTPPGPPPLRFPAYAHPLNSAQDMLTAEVKMNTGRGGLNGCIFGGTHNSHNTEQVHDHHYNLSLSHNHPRGGGVALRGDFQGGPTGDGASRNLKVEHTPLETLLGSTFSTSPQSGVKRSGPRSISPGLKQLRIS